MNQNIEIAFLFENHQWKKLTNSYLPNEIAKSLSFKNGLYLAYRLLYNDAWEETFQEYAVKFLYEIRKIYPENWNETWEYDALLGLACYITRKYDERYEAYKRAFDKTNTPPPGLLIELARCCICPDSPPISYDEAIDLVKKAIKEALYTDGVGLLSHIYSLKNDKINEKYWAKILENSNQKLESPSIEPKFLIEDICMEKIVK
jgi:hypothetical protein